MSVNTLQLEETENFNSIKFIIDSGATHHCVNDKNLLKEFKPFQNPEHVNVASEEDSLTVYSTGYIDISNTLCFVNVWYVPKLRENVISVAQIRMAITYFLKIIKNA